MKVIESMSDISLRSEILTGNMVLSSHLAREWDDLFERSVSAPPYLCHTWTDTFIRNKQMRGVPQLILVWSGEKLVALLALAVRVFFGIRIAEPIGTSEPTYLGLLIDPEHPEAVNSIAEIIINQKPIDLLYNTNLSSEDGPTNELFKELAKKGFLCLCTYRTICHYIKLGISYDEYIKQTKTAKRRKKLQYEERKLFSSSDANVQYYEGKEVTSDVLKRLTEIQQSSRMKNRGAAVLGQSFYQELFLDMAKCGLCNVWLMTINGEDAAFVLDLEAHGELHYYRTAFKLKFDPSLSIGKILTMRVIRNACDNGVLYFDFGHSDAEYKRFWGTDSKYVSRIAAGQGFMGRAGVICLWFAWWLAKHEWLRKQYRRVKKNLFAVQD